MAFKLLLGVGNPGTPPVHPLYEILLNDVITTLDRCRCKELVQTYLQDPSPEARLTVGSDMRKIQFSFQLLKVYM